MSAGVQQIEQELRAKLIVVAHSERSEAQKLLSSLAQELAMEINSIEHILDHHGLDRVEFERIIGLPLFQQFYREARIAWGASSSAGARIKAKMESMVEEALPNLFTELCKDGLTAAKVELVKTMMKGGGIGEKSGGDGSQGVQIIINMDSGAHAKPVTIEGVAISHDAEDL